MRSLNVTPDQIKEATRTHSIWAYVNLEDFFVPANKLVSNEPAKNSKLDSYGCISRPIRASISTRENVVSL